MNPSMPPNAPARGLGRGLGALIPQRPDAPLPGALDVPVDQVRPNPQQPRTSFEADALDELARSIREHGLLQPIVVTRVADGTYQLVAGERRWRAARLAGLRTVPAVLKDPRTPRESLELALVENVQRRDLNPLEEAGAYHALVEEHGLTQEAVAQRVGRSRVAVANTLRLLQLPAEIQQAIADGALTEGHARAILTAQGGRRQLELMDAVLHGGLSVRETEALARRSTSAAPSPFPAREQAPPGSTRGPDTDADVARLEDQLRQALGTRVQVVRRGRSGGRVVIHFYSDDELEGLIERLRGP